MKALPPLCAAILLASMPAAAVAEVPAPVRDMIDAAIATGEPETVRTVIGVARSAHPDGAAELDAMLAEYEAGLAVEAQEADAAREAEIRSAGLFENWSGRGELGAFNSTGNTENTGITAALGLTREGINWRHKLTGRVDYQESNGVKTREQFLAAYEPNLKLSDRLFAYGLAQYERDRFQGFSARYAISGGIGYQVVDQPDLQLSVKAGPAYRITEFNDGTSASRLAALLGLDFDWQITDRIALTHDTNGLAETQGSATVIADSENISVNLVTGLNAKISTSLTARLSYAVEHDTNPPAGAEKTDTLSRVTIIYDF